LMMLLEHHQWYTVNYLAHGKSDENSSKYIY
jgi:hypothetical protein